MGGMRKTEENEGMEESKRSDATTYGLELPSGVVGGFYFLSVGGERTQQ